MGNEPKACVFLEAIPRLTYNLDSKARAVAEHIQQAQNHPNDTYPLLVPTGTPPPRDKRIPGKYIAGDPYAPGLHRITPELHPESKDNENHKDGACYLKGPYQDMYWDTGLPTPPLPPDEQCDEYPFRSTLEGAANDYWDFSGKAVPRRDNASAGGELLWYYLNDRILAYDFELPSPRDINDRFYVEITTGCGECGGGGGGPVPPGNAPPTVDAGPDVTGPEGAAVALNGTVTDPDDTPDVNWSYQLGSNTDPGMTCRFSAKEQARTTISCTDDGTVKVTLAADDHHHGGPVTDTATVSVTNAAPAVRIDSPKPDQLFNGREPTPVTVSFADPGANDAHTCTLTFGDGSPPVRGTVQEQAGIGQCTGGHTYGYDGLGPRTIRVTVDDDDGGTASDAVRVVIYVPGAGFAARVTGLIGIPRTPDVHCPPSDTQSTAALSTLLGSVKGLNVDCSLDTQEGRTVVDTTVGDVNLLAGAIRITDIESHCTAGAEGISRSSRLGAINGISIGTGKGSLTIGGIATVSYNETTTDDRGRLVQNAIRITTPVQEITIANCTLG
ncbi:choice-of-anchor P family protein [Streptomyces sp. P9(2023)]|uniref:choice-of-anchor P family protein n=1 Tax=Streptomyces sp. P9(2023) TaxID=3064394 RepID=UPI0028F40FB4|nr:choice-of-anchor P family protein [Streptomyces sp. P9(2023)]MDT9688862.1 choice-of-anchor P family protein [Streptomyces sp. P9(2023)]